MDNEMIERVAKAAYDKFNENLIPNLELPWEKLPEDFKFKIMEAQKSAINALREPTEKMVSAIHGCYPDVPDKYAYAAAKLKIETMIDAIIND